MTPLEQNGYSFGNFVKFVTNNDVVKYNDHRRFAKAWFAFNEQEMMVYINIDNCDNENVLLHEMAHVLLLMNKYTDIDRYHAIANEFLTNTYGNDMGSA